MAHLITVLVDEVRVKGPFKKKDGSGEFDTHVFVAEAEEYVKFTGVREPNIAKKGDTAQILFERINSPKGMMNKVIKINVVSEAPKEPVIAEAKKVPKLGTDTPVNLKNVTSISSTSVSSTLDAKNLSIARMNAVTSAVNVLTSSGEEFGMEDIIEVANRIVDYTMEPYNKS